MVVVPWSGGCDEVGYNGGSRWCGVELVLWAEMVANEGAYGADGGMETAARWWRGWDVVGGHGDDDEVVMRSRGGGW
nr:hypothetical protein [Tanacetum cinerariifolium]